MIPENYTPVIDDMESQQAIKKNKDSFQQELASIWPEEIIKLCGKNNIFLL